MATKGVESTITPQPKVVTSSAMQPAANTLVRPPKTRYPNAVVQLMRTT